MEKVRKGMPGSPSKDKEGREKKVCIQTNLRIGIWYRSSWSFGLTSLSTLTASLLSISGDSKWKFYALLHL